MAKAGFCSQCGREVWLLGDGRCQFGHDASCVLAIRDAEPETAPVGSNRATGRVWPWVVGGVLVVGLLISALSVIGVWLIGRSFESISHSESAFTPQWRARVERDYPGWRVARFQVVNTESESGPETDYWVTLLAPGRKDALPVYYVSTKGGPAVSQDEVFRSDGAFHHWAPQLLVYLNDNYYNKGLAITSVASDEGATAYITWTKPGDDSDSADRVDALTLETGEGTWTLSP